MKYLLLALAIFLGGCASQAKEVSVDYGYDTDNVPDVFYRPLCAMGFMYVHFFDKDGRLSIKGPVGRCPTKSGGQQQKPQGESISF